MVMFYLFIHLVLVLCGDEGRQGVAAPSPVSPPLLPPPSRRPVVLLMCLERFFAPCWLSGAPPLLIRLPLQPSSRHELSW